MITDEIMALAWKFALHIEKHGRMDCDADENELRTALEGLLAAPASLPGVERPGTTMEQSSAIRSNLEYIQSSNLRRELYEAKAALTLAEGRLKWLHSSASHSVDGYEWGIFQVQWNLDGSPKVVQQTLSDFSDLDAAMETSQGESR